jgi:histidine triad (HIT) family protein
MYMLNEPSIFTRIINHEIPGFIPYENDTVAILVVLEGHVIVVPKVHYRDIYELPEDVGAEIMRVAVRTAKALQQATNCDGINLIQSNGPVAGQEVFHFHLHIKPRFKDDSVTLHWDTTTRPSEERETLAAALKKELEN